VDEGQLVSHFRSNYGRRCSCIYQSIDYNGWNLPAFSFKYYCNVVRVSDGYLLNKRPSKMKNLSRGNAYFFLVTIGPSSCSSSIPYVPYRYFA
jgi:hypothetical protein